MRPGATQLARLHDRAEIAAFLRRDAALHLYALGDLDEFYWPRTRWFGLRKDGALEAVALLYSGSGTPTLLALGPEPPDALQALLEQLPEELPPRVYLHLTPGLARALEPAYELEPRGVHLRMRLARPEALSGPPGTGVQALSEADLAELQGLYDSAYPDNFFDPRMLQTGQYFGIREGTELIAAAGVHVYSPAQGVAAVGNVVTRPDRRGRGLATVLCAHLCRSLLREVGLVGLNVQQDNHAALACYRKLGFEPVAVYEEHMARARSGPGAARPPGAAPDRHR